MPLWAERVALWCVQWRDLFTVWHCVTQQAEIKEQRFGGIWKVRCWYSSKPTQSSKTLCTYLSQVYDNKVAEFIGKSTVEKIPWRVLICDSSWRGTAMRVISLDSHTQHWEGLDIPMTELWDSYLFFQQNTNKQTQIRKTSEQLTAIILAYKPQPKNST